MEEAALVTNTPPAGGRATQAGMDFGAAVGVWFASHLVAVAPVGRRFGLGVGAFPIRLQFETGTGLDDIEVGLSDGSVILIQCKTRPALSSSAHSGLGSTIAQLVRFVVSSATSRPYVDSARTSAVLAVATDAPASLNVLEAACRMFDTGGTWPEVYARVSESQRSALDILRAHADAEWSVQRGVVAPDDELARLAMLLHIVRFDASDTGSDLRECTRIVGTRLFGREEAGSTPVESLNGIVRRLVRSGAPADKEGLLRLLRAAGHEDLHSPMFDADIARLTNRTQTEVARLERHSRLSIDGGVAIPRGCMPALKAAAEDGSLLVIGEPGAGKTGVLVALAQERLRSGLPTVFLSVDDLYGVTTLDDLRATFDLDAHVLDSLQNWPGSRPGLLIIDALDASRGGPSESLFARFIEDALRTLGERWSVLASIRTFDLRNGRRFREAMVGTPPSALFAEPGLETVRHFKIPRLGDDELVGLTQQSTQLGELLGNAPPSLRELLKNVFNLSIASELISGGTNAASIVSIATQSGLLEQYEDQRLSSSRLQTAVAASVKSMIDRRRLTVRKVDIGHEALDDVLRSGVLVASGDRVHFAHHVIFDHVAGRFYLDWTDTRRLQTQVTEDPAIGLLLGPSLKFAMERVWRDDVPGRSSTWALTLAITSANGIDPVVASVALRTVAERVESPVDVQGLCDLLRDTKKADVIGPALSRLSRFVDMSLAEKGAPSSSAMLSWAEVAVQAALAAHRLYADAARFLLFTLSKRADFADRSFALKFGQAARQLLSLAWQFEPPLSNLASNAIRMVTKSFDTDVTASRELLSRILQEPHFTEHAHEEAPWLAEGVSTILKADPDFAVEIYDVLFERVAPAEGDSWMGGNVSRIMPLRSNKRQDYEHARWHLQQVLPSFLATHPDSGTVAVNRASLGLAGDRRTRLRSMEPREVAIDGDRVLLLVEDGLSLQQWRDSNERSGGQPGSEILSSYVTFLLECTDADFVSSIRAVISETAAASVWARILGIAAERPGVADDLLWPIASSDGLLELTDVVRDAITYLAAAFPRRSVSERRNFEAALLANVRCADEDAHRVWQSRAARFLSVVAEESLVNSPLSELRNELEQQGLLTGNRPYMTMEFSWGEPGDITDSLLKGDGVNLDDGPDAELRQTVRPLDSLMRNGDGLKTPEVIGELWSLTVAVITTIDRLTAPPPHEQVLHSSWGSISNAVEKIVQSEHYSEGLPGHPSRNALIEVLDRMATSPFPEERSPSDSGLMSWGNWDVRVYVASSYMSLAASSYSSAENFRDRLVRMLDDPAPTVRLQVAQSLNTLWEVDRDHMWRMAAKVAAEETDTGVIGFFIGGPLLCLADVAPDRCEELVDGILARLQRWHEEKSRPGDFHEAIARMAARLWIVSGKDIAQGWILDWVRTLGDSDAFLWPLVSWLRGALFARFQKDATDRDREIQNRAREVLRAVVDAAGDALAAAKPALMDGSTAEPQRMAAERQYKVGLRLMEHSCNQLYFGSGAFKNGPTDRNDEGLADEGKMREFLAEYEDILDRIALSGNATVAYHLVEVYEHLASASPELVFEKVAALVLGPAASDGYHYESLALDTVVRLVRRYLADYRAAFEDASRRARLVSVLELFSNAGWPEALKLLYELPDLLR